MKPTILAIILTGIVPAGATVVSWNYDRFGTVEGAAIAGVSPAANWNNSWPANPVTNLIDKTGAATTLDIAYTSYNTWSIVGAGPAVDTDGTSNKRLLNGYLNAGPAPWSPAITSSSVALSQVPYPRYDLIVYFSSDGADREGSVTDGTTTYYFKSLGAPSVTGGNAILTKATDTTTAGYTVGANYAIFTGLTGASKTVTVQMRDNDEWGGIAGFQIVADLTAFPEIGLEPEDQTAPVGGQVTFSSSAVGDPAPTYQWQFSLNGTTGWAPVSGETQASLTLFGVSMANEGYYRVVATNANGSDTSRAAHLDVFNPPPMIVVQPDDIYAQVGTTAQLTVAAVTNGNLGFQWYKGTTLIPGATEDTLVLSNISLGDAGSYTVKVSDDTEPGLVTESQPAIVHVFTAWSGLASHDPFSDTAYAVGELPLQNPPVTGYDGAWTDINFGDAEPAVTAGTLAYSNPQYAGSTGNQVAKGVDAAAIGVANSGRTYRLLSPSLVAASNTSGVRYLSWLYKNGNENTAPDPYIHSTLALYHDTGGAAPAGDAAQRAFSAGISSTDYGTNGYAFRCNDAQVGDLAVPVDGNVHLFVVKFDLSAEDLADSVTVWIDPVLGGSGEPAGGTTLGGMNLRFESLALSDYASNSCAWDEIRWGSTFSSVTTSGTPANTYASWIATYPLVGGLTGFKDDADKDGIANGVENFLGTRPDTASQGLVQIGRTATTVTFQHSENATPATDIAAAYEWSADLVTWRAGGVSSGGTTVTFSAGKNTPAAGTTTVTATMAGTIPAKLFTRLSVSKAP